MPSSEVSKHVIEIYKREPTGWVVRTQVWQSFDAALEAASYLKAVEMGLVVTEIGEDGLRTVHQVHGEVPKDMGW